MVVREWRMGDYGKGGHDGKFCMNHLGFRVASLPAFLAGTEHLGEIDPSLKPRQFMGENVSRREMLARCALGQHQMCDPEGVLIDIE